MTSVAISIIRVIAPRVCPLRAVSNEMSGDDAFNEDINTEFSSSNVWLYLPFT